MKEINWRFRSNSKIEKLIMDHNFGYIEPYFYNNDFALRCELGIGKNTGEYMKNAKKRACEIYDKIFEKKPDAIFYDFYYIDYFEDSEFGSMKIKDILKNEKKELKFFERHDKKYDNTVIFDVPKNDLINGFRKNRIVFYTDEKYPYKKIIKKHISVQHKKIHFVSFENECILSIYDDRGCDIVFATKEKMREFYYKLEDYLLVYDIEIMKKRIAE